MAAEQTPTHPVSRAAHQMRTTMTDLADVALWSMDGDEAAVTLDELTQAQAQLTALKLKVLARVDQTSAPSDAGFGSTANWYAHRSRVTHAQAHRELRLAKALRRHDPTSQALAVGALHLEQATAVMNAVDLLPEGLDPEIVEDAEALLVEEATRYDAKHLRYLGNHLVEVAAPEVAEAHTAKLLEKQERDAAADARFVMYDDGQGRVHGKFTVPALVGAALQKALFALAAPKHQTAVHGSLPERKPTPERLGQAFADYVLRFPVDELPQLGGMNATVVVTMTLESLLGGLKPAKLDTGEELSATAARLLACEARIIPAVLGGKGQVLDVGRADRFFKEAQRIAKAIEQPTCAGQGCDCPAWMCHLHHWIPWSLGGRTDLKDAVWLCPWHHHRAHDPAFTMTKLPTGRIEFTIRR